MDVKMLVLLVIVLFSTITVVTAVVTATPQRCSIPTILNGNNDAGSVDVIDGAIRTGDGKGGAWT